jgi:hypothetical protein
MSFIADLFSGPSKPKTVKPPATDTKGVQDAAAEARRRAAAAKGRASTDIVGSRLGNVG